MKNAKGILILILLFVGIPFGLLALLWKDRCARSTVELTRSPNGEWTAETTRVDCGPSMKVATEVTLRRGEEEQTESVLVLAQGEGLKAAWEGDARLVFTLPSEAEVVKGRQEWRGVEIAIVGQKR